MKACLDEINIEISGLWVKQIILHNVGGPRPILIEKKTGPRGRKNSEHWLQTCVSTSALPWGSSLLTDPSNFGLDSLHNHVNQSLKYIPPHPSLYIHILFILFFWRTLTDTILNSIPVLCNYTGSVSMWPKILRRAGKALTQWKKKNWLAGL